MYAIDHRAQLSGRWGWMLFSGIVDLILAGIIFAGLPGTAALPRAKNELSISAEKKGQNGQWRLLNATKSQSSSD